jgi:hypothetical protein
MGCEPYGGGVMAVQMSFGQTFARTMGGGADRDVSGRGEREVSASGSASMFMRLLNRPQSTRERDGEAVETQVQSDTHTRKAKAHTKHTQVEGVG